MKGISEFSGASFCSYLVPVQWVWLQRMQVRGVRREP